jgi:hypothetical protein
MSIDPQYILESLMNISLPGKCVNDIPLIFAWEHCFSIDQYVLLLSDCFEFVSTNTSNFSKDGSMIYSSYCIDSPFSIFIFIGSIQAGWIRKMEESVVMWGNLPLHL